jgi:CRISPR-associated endonuclease/helicase Cas3
LHRQLKRTTEHLAGVMTDDALVVEMSKVSQALTIVNSRRHALTLYQAGKSAAIDGLIHLTTRQTASDRRSILHDVRERLKNQKPCRVIATSLVEAGVDIDFPRVWRAEAGLDQLTQAAGRCNREGRRPVEDSVVTIFKPAEARPPAEIKGLIGDMLRILGEHHSDLFSPQTIEAYFREVYWRKTEEGLDKHAVMKKFVVGFSATDFAYRSVAEEFRLIESGMEPVVVTIDQEPQAILRALSGGMPPGLAARKLQNYIVQVPPRDRSTLIANGHVRFVGDFGDQFAELITKGLYSRGTGLCWEKADELGFDGIV